jgi:hypothetical protein
MQPPMPAWPSTQWSSAHTATEPGAAPELPAHGHEHAVRAVANEDGAVGGACRAAKLRGLSRRSRGRMGCVCACYGTGAQPLHPPMKMRQFLQGLAGGAQVTVQ